MAKFAFPNNPKNVFDEMIADVFCSQTERYGMVAVMIAYCCGGMKVKNYS